MFFQCLDKKKMKKSNSDMLPFTTWMYESNTKLAIENTVNTAPAIHLTLKTALEI